jgi:hypothetical protein
VKLTYNDRQHAYWLDGKRCKSVTAVAKVPEDTNGLTNWIKRQIVTGMALTPRLVENAAAHHQDREQLDAIAEEAMAAAGANDKAARGTAAHRITESHDTGAFVVDTSLSAQVLAHWPTLLARHGLEVVPELIERVVVHPEHRIAGRFDRIVRCPDGALRVLDLKTGDKAVRYPHSMAVQLALYANAPLFAVMNEAGTEATEFDDTQHFDPRIDWHKGYVVHLPAEGEPRVYEVDLEAGWQCFTEVILPTYRWRERKDLVAPAMAADGLPSAPEFDVDPPDPAQRSELARRIDGLRSIDGGIDRLAAYWPVGVATLKNSDAHTAEELDAIAAAVQRAEIAVEAPIDPPPSDPAPPAVEAPEAPAWKATPCPEGDEAPEACAALRDRLATLTPEQLVVIGALIAEATAAGVDFRPSMNPSVRRFELGRLAFAIALHLDGDADLTRAALALAWGVEPPPAPLGALVGACTVAQAQAAVEAIDAVSAGSLAAHFDGDTLTLRPVAA